MKEKCRFVLFFAQIIVNLPPESTKTRTPMRKQLLLFLVSFMPLMASADSDFRPMLVEGKTWYYTYHHFDESTNTYDKNTYRVTYKVKGDTVIDGRQYKKMYRYDAKTRQEVYYGAFREDEEGCVWQYEHYLGTKEDQVIIDITSFSYFHETVLLIPDIIKIRGQLLRRYHYREIYGVEGVGLMDYGIVRTPMDDVDTPCDYEQFDYVTGGNTPIFTNKDFTAPNYIELTEDEQRFVDRNNDFAFSLFRKLSDKSSKVLSPLSVTYALGMLNNGAAGQTQQEIYTVLGFDDVDTQNAFCQKMINELNKAGLVDKTTEATILGTIFVNQGQGWQLQYDFSHTVNQYYYAYPTALDFYDSGARDVINKWASDRTKGMIDEVISEEEFDPNTVSYLLNAIYFKGNWSDPFDIKDTQEEAFAGGKTVQMMHKKDVELKYAENDLYQTVSLPYGNGTYYIQLFLPREGKTLGELLDGLNGKNWKIQSSNYEVDLKMPRFETTTNQNLVEVMTDLGMPSAFNPQAADFSRLYTDNQGQNLYINMMKQVAKIKLDEQGTEAAAVTIDGFGGSSMPRKVNFHANRPFLYLIGEQSTGIILFMGQYTGPDLASPIAFTQAQDKCSTSHETGTLYDLQGRRLSGKPARGIYIENGKKVLVVGLSR